MFSRGEFWELTNPRLLKKGEMGSASSTHTLASPQHAKPNKCILKQHTLKFTRAMWVCSKRRTFEQFQISILKSSHAVVHVACICYIANAGILALSSHVQCEYVCTLTLHSCRQYATQPRARLNESHRGCHLLYRMWCIDAKKAMYKILMWLRISMSDSLHVILMPAWVCRHTHIARVNFWVCLFGNAFANISFILILLLHLLACVCVCVPSDVKMVIYLKATKSQLTTSIIAYSM